MTDSVGGYSEVSILKTKDALLKVKVELLYTNATQSCLIKWSILSFVNLHAKRCHTTKTLHY
ncbi:hypothetical protein CS542_00900 [Pedobacter sp. IW39]|nr:hypothetical protein CS542_00900 [Pedobacter sp. IW39]